MNQYINVEGLVRAFFGNDGLIGIHRGGSQLSF